MKKVLLGCCVVLVVLAFCAPDGFCAVKNEEILRIIMPTDDPPLVDGGSSGGCNAYYDMFKPIDCVAPHPECVTLWQRETVPPQAPTYHYDACVSRTGYTNFQPGEGRTDGDCYADVLGDKDCTMDATDEASCSQHFDLMNACSCDATPGCMSGWYREINPPAPTYHYEACKSPTGFTNKQGGCGLPNKECMIDFQGDTNCGFSTVPPSCGNGVCDTSIEDGINCPSDCPCASIGGTLVSGVCKISGSTCPSGWSRDLNWSTTSPKSCSFGTCGMGPRTVTTGSHAWANQLQETATYQSCAVIVTCQCGSVQTCYANITEVGCRKN